MRCVPTGLLFVPTAAEFLASVPPPVFGELLVGRSKALVEALGPGEVVALRWPRGGNLGLCLPWPTLRSLLTPPPLRLSAGMTAIPCACLGIFLGGLLVKKLSLSALGAIRMAMLVNLVSTACYVSFLFLGCDTGPVAGVTVPYGNA